MKRLTLCVFAAIIGLAPAGCSEDLNKNVPKSLPPGAKPFTTSEKGPGGAPANQKTDERAK